MPKAYNIVQTTFLLNLAANGASSVWDTEANLQSRLSVYLSGGTDNDGITYPGILPLLNPQLAGGDWRVVWGPCVFNVRGDTRPGYASNAMYVAHSPTLKTYVVAIAATNPTSLYDWIKEDGAVSPLFMAKWPLQLPFEAKIHLPPDPSVPYVSAATALGVSNLMTQMRDTGNYGSIKEFLDKTVAGDSTLIFTGHSLAGALSPSLALLLCPKPKDSGWKQVLVLPTAGASPGNKAFAELFAAAYPKTSAGIDAPYAVWNTDHANKRDLVPHAWNRLDMVITEPTASINYPSIFGMIGPVLGTAVFDAVKGGEALAFGGDYQNLRLTEFEPDWGTYNWDVEAPPQWQPLPDYTDANPIRTPAEFGACLLAAHTSQYPRYFDVAPLPRMLVSQDKTKIADALKGALAAAASISS